MKLEQEISNKDQEAYTKALFELVTKLQIENQQLKEKLDHAEELLKNVEVATPVNSTGGGHFMPRYMNLDTYLNP